MQVTPVLLTAAVQQIAVASIIITPIQYLLELRCAGQASTVRVYSVNKYGI